MLSFISDFIFIILVILGFIMEAVARFRFNFIKDLVPDVSFYNYKDPLLSNLHVGSVVIISLALIVFADLLIRAIIESISFCTKDEVKSFLMGTLYILLGIGTVIGIISGIWYGIMALLNTIKSTPVPQLMSAQLNLTRLLS